MLRAHAGTLATARNPTAASILALPHGALRTNTQPRADLPARDLERLTLAWRWHAADILEDLHRSLVNSPHTLRALSAGAPNPVHGSERRSLTATVTRRLLILGCEPNEVSERRITYEAVDAIRHALLGLEA